MINSGMALNKLMKIFIHILVWQILAEEQAKKKKKERIIIFVVFTATDFILTFPTIKLNISGSKENNLIFKH